MKFLDLPIVLVVARSLQEFIYQVDYLYHQENKKVTKVRQGEFVINNVRHIYINVDRPEHMLGFHGVKVEYWGSLIGLKQETLDLIQKYKESAERP